MTTRTRHPLACAAALCLLGFPVLALATELEIATTSAIAVYALPKRPEVSGNQRVGVLPARATCPVKREVLGKDFAAYEIDCAPPGAKPVRGFVLLGETGLQVRPIK
jgi:hypothetical protein